MNLVICFDDKKRDKKCVCYFPARRSEKSPIHLRAAGARDFKILDRLSHIK